MALGPSLPTKKVDMLILKLHAFHNTYMYTGTYIQLTLLCLRVLSQNSKCMLSNFKIHGKNLKVKKLRSGFKK